MAEFRWNAHQSRNGLQGLLWRNGKPLAWHFDQKTKSVELMPHSVFEGTIIGCTIAKTLEAQAGFVSKGRNVFLLPDLSVRKSIIHFLDVKDLDRKGDLLCDALLIQRGKVPHPIVCWLRPAHTTKVKVSHISTNQNNAFP